jgi:hypothetical protein
LRREASVGSRVVLEVPEDVSEDAKQKAFQAAVLTLWKEGAISTGVAAAELELTRHDFLDLLAAEGIPVVRRSPDIERIKEAQQKLATSRP